MSTPLPDTATPTAPATMRAVVTRLFRSVVVRDVPTPVPEPDEILVKVAAAALNPTDHKAKVIARSGTLLGCDFAGTVVAAPAGSGFEPGDEVAGAVMGGWGPREGAFAEYLVTDPALVWHRPVGITPEAAATMNVSWCTCALALEKLLGSFATSHSLPIDSSLIVYSATSCTGQYAIQYYRHYHPAAPIIALASPAAHGRLQALGATLCLPYTLSTEDISRAIEAAGLQKPQLAFDTRSMGDSVAKLEGLMAEPGKIVGVLPPKKGTRLGINKEHVFAYTVTGKPIRLLWLSWPASPEDHDLASKRLKQLISLLGPDGPLQTVITKAADAQGGRGARTEAGHHCGGGA